MPHYSPKRRHGLAWIEPGPLPNESWHARISHSASQENLRLQRKIWVVFLIAGACHGPQCGVKCIQSTSSHLISLRIALLLSFHSCFGQRSNYCYSDFRKKIMHSLSISRLLHVPPIQPFFTLVIKNYETHYKLLFILL
jgi:hypothetical protein